MTYDDERAAEEQETFRLYTNSESEDRPLSARLFLRTVFIAMGAAAAGILAIAVILVAVRDEGEWSPLGPFPIQTVVDDDKVIDVSEGVVEVEGQKCRTGTDGVQVSGSLSWRLIRPPGYVSVLPPFPAVVHVNGCQTFTFANAIPPDVVEHVCRIGPAEWHIVGAETPIGDLVGDFVTPRSGLRLGWETEPFTLTCDG